MFLGRRDAALGDTHPTRQLRCHTVHLRREAIHGPSLIACLQLGMGARNAASPSGVHPDVLQHATHLPQQLDLGEGLSDERGTRLQHALLDDGVAGASPSARCSGLPRRNASVEEPNSPPPIDRPFHPRTGARTGRSAASARTEQVCPAPVSPGCTGAQGADSAGARRAPGSHTPHEVAPDLDAWTAGGLRGSAPNLPAPGPEFFLRAGVGLVKRLGYRKTLVSDSNPGLSRLAATS